MTLELSVVVPTYNRADVLDRCLEHLARQTLDPERFEVIVADDASEDSTPDVGARWEASGRLQLRYRRCDKGFAGGARNRGVEWARAPRIVFLGDDILASGDLLASHLAGQARWGDATVLVGEVRLAEPRTPFMRYLEDEGVHHAFGRLRASAGRPVSGWLFYACNASLPATAFADVGGFDLRLTRMMEDGEFGMRLYRAGWPIRFLPEARGTHVHPMTVDRYVQFLRVGRADAATVAQWTHDLGEFVEIPASRPVRDRLVGDRAIDVAAQWTARMDDRLPANLRRRLYRLLLRYERRKGLLQAHLRPRALAADG